MNIEERVENVEKRVERGENRTKLIEQAILQMKDLVVSHEGRLDDFSRSIGESREDFNFKLNAVIDLQLENSTGLRESRISNEELRESITELRESINELKISSTELRRASESQLTRIEKLESK
jgi:hypothetical protein